MLNNNVCMQASTYYIHTLIYDIICTQYVESTESEMSSETHYAELNLKP